MKKNYPYLTDQKFLTQLVSQINQVYYATITMLDWSENIIRSLQGKVTTANVSIVGNSAVRRTANVTFLMDPEDADAEQMLELNKKIYLQIGYQNTTNQYTDFPIVWFPLGLYIITGISFSNSTSGLSASLQLKDKMCLLNGECGGTLPAAVVFDNYEVQDGSGEGVIVRPTIYQIIMELLNHFGGEQLGNIIISDIDTRVKRVMEWTADVPLFILKQANGGSYYFTTNEVDANTKRSSGDYIWQLGCPFEKGSNVGFILDDFSFPGDLIGNAGDTVVTILDKIKNTLGNFEYFYDVYGNFRFQQIKNYLNNTQTKYILDSLRDPQNPGPNFFKTNNSEAYIVQRTDGKAVFSFKDNDKLIMNYASTPQILNIKNDYVVWGLRKTSKGDQIPIRYHLAIDNKPQIGNTYEVIKYVDLYDESLQKWYMPIKSAKSVFPAQGVEGVVYYDTSGRQAYIWKKVNGLSQYVPIDGTLQTIKTTDWRTELYFQGVAAQPNGVDSNFYYAELAAEWPKIYDIQNGKFRDQFYKDLSGVDYYLDFIHPTSALAKKISVNNIGRRTIVLNENENINCVFEPYIPDVVIINTDFTEADSSQTDMKKLRQECIDKGQQYVQVNSNIYNYLTPGVGFNSGYEEIKQMLFQYINYSDSISLQSMPLYFLEPNTCIEVEDKNSFISGLYLINSLNFSLDISSGLSISANKVLNRF